MPMTVNKWSPYMNIQKEHLAKQAGVKKWEDIFLQPYEQAAQQVQTQAAYDISGAFSQYKQAQLSAMRNTQLGSGFKEQIASSLAGQYATAFSKTKQQEASDIYGLQQQASETLASEEAKLQERAKMYAGLEAAILEQHGIDLERAQTNADAIWKSGEKDEDNIYGLGYFELQPDGSYKITERGIDFFDKALNKGLALTDEKGNETGEYESFEKYLQATGDTELIDFYLQNFDTAKQFIGGLESGDMSWDPEERQYRLDFEDLYKHNPNTLEPLKNITVFENDKAKLDTANKMIQLEKANDKDTPGQYLEIIQEKAKVSDGGKAQNLVDVGNYSDGQVTYRGGAMYQYTPELRKDEQNAMLLIDYYNDPEKALSEFKTEKEILEYLDRVDKASKALAEKYWWNLYKKKTSGSNTDRGERAPGGLKYDVSI